MKNANHKMLIQDADCVLAKPGGAPGFRFGEIS